MKGDSDNSKELYLRTRLWLPALLGGPVAMFCSCSLWYYRHEHAYPLPPESIAGEPASQKLSTVVPTDMFAHACSPGEGLARLVNPLEVDESSESSPSSIQP
jgi:hypothetical protein